MWVVLNQCPDSFNLIGPDCSSWGVTARGTSMRSFINPRDRMGLAWVAANYCLVSRILDCNYIMLHHVDTPDRSARAAFI